MILQTYPSPALACEAVADLIVARITAFAPTMNRKFVLCLPTGSTPLGVYKELAKRCRAQEVSFEHVVTINVDEYLGLAADHPQSYSYFMERELFSQIDIPPAQTHLLSGLMPDPDFECARYEALITSLGGIHLLFAGIGVNGHVAFNEPGSAFGSRTRVVGLDEGTRMANARFFDDPSQVPTHALSMGLGTILDASEIVILALGGEKAEAIERSIEGPVNHLCPGSVLQLHPDVKVFTDEPASALLQNDTKRYLAPTLPLVQVDGMRTNPSSNAESPIDLPTPPTPLSPTISAQAALKRKPGLRLITAVPGQPTVLGVDSGRGDLMLSVAEEEEDDAGPGW